MLRVTPKQSRAETGPARDDRGAAWNNQGVGMIYDNELHTFKLKSAVRGTLQPNNIPK
jgi:hypothetical protein